LLDIAFMVFFSCVESALFNMFIKRRILR
jgi:hypothetical protein